MDILEHISDRTVENRILISNRKEVNHENR